MKTAFLVVLFAALLLCRASSGSSDSELKRWADRAKQFHVGARRADIERVFRQFIPPPNGSHPVITGGSMMSGGKRVFQYYVAQGILISVAYDWTGESLNDAGEVVSYDSPENRLLRPITVEYRAEFGQPNAKNK